MTTRIGPAYIEVQLDVQRALADLTQLERRIREMSSGQVEMRREEVRHEEARNEKVDEGQRKLEKLQEQAKSGRFGAGISKLAGLAAVVTGAAYLGEKVIAGAAETIKETWKGIPGAEQLANFESDIMLKVSNLISEGLARVTALVPTYEGMKDISRSQLLLGEQPTLAEALGLTGVLYDVNVAMARLERQKEKFVPEYVGRLIGDFLGGGMKR